MVQKEEKEKIIKEKARNEKDTGSPEVQIGILNEEINDLLSHLSTHIHDNSSRRGLIKKVSQRRKLLKYLEAVNPRIYKKVLQDIRPKKHGK